ncbi:MAG: C25 family cysteine peptidase [Lachnospiraceae bacterium]|nr:C25 family cysteine peptidase [Lachnospiraceae bacterium]
MEWKVFLSKDSTEAEQEPAAADKSVITSDYTSLNMRSGSTKIKYCLKGAYFMENPSGEKEKILIDLPEAGHTMQVGAPMLPQEGLPVALPPGAVFKGIANVKANEEVLTGTYDILPCPEEVRGDAEEVFEKDSTIYESSNIFPADIVEYATTSKIEGIRCANILVNPIRFIPNLKKVQVVNEVEFEVLYDYDDSLDAKDSNIKPNPKFTDNILGYDGEEEKDSSDKPQLVIITTDELKSGIADFVNVKKDKYDVIIGLTGEIYADYKDLSKVDAIRAYLMSEHKKWHLEYVLIAGDIDQVPTPVFYDSDGGGNVAYENYYCCEKDCIVPLFPLSRIPASDQASLKSQLAVSSAYQSNKSDTRKSVCLTTDASPQGGAEFRANAESVADMIHDKFNVAKRYDGESKKDELLKTINDGVGFLNYRGHGHQEFWGSSIGLNLTDVENLKVGNNTPIVFSVACNTGAIHHRKCFASTWMRALKSVAFLGASTPSYRSVNSQFCKHIWEAIYSHGLTAVGDIFKWATLTLHRNNPTSNTVIHNIKCYVQLGDPTVNYADE